MGQIRNAALWVVSWSLLALSGVLMGCIYFHNIVPRGFCHQALPLALRIAESTVKFFER